MQGFCNRWGFGTPEQGDKTDHDRDDPQDGPIAQGSYAIYRQSTAEHECKAHITSLDPGSDVDLIAYEPPSDCTDRGIRKI